MGRKVADLTALKNDLDTLSSASREGLQKRWKELYRTNPPNRISRQLLLRAIAYRLQEKALGGIKPSVRRIWTRQQWIVLVAGRLPYRCPPLNPAPDCCGNAGADP